MAIYCHGKARFLKLVGMRWIDVDDFKLECTAHLTATVILVSKCQAQSLLGYVECFFSVVILSNFS